MCAAVLPFSAFQTTLDPTFWNALTTLKIDVLKLSDATIDCTGSYTAGKSVVNRDTGEQVSLGCFVEFSGSSLHAAPAQNLSQISIPLRGTLRNFNTIEDFKNVDKQALFSEHVARLWNRFESQEILTAEELNPFFLLTFADLKKYKYYYWFCFPAFVALPSWQLSSPLRSLSERFSPEEISEVGKLYTSFMRGEPREGAAAWLTRNPLRLHPISAFSQVSSSSTPELIFCDPSSLPTSVGWPLRNILTFVAVRFNCRSLNVILWRGEESSRMLCVSSTASFGQQFQATGWEKNIAGKLAPSLADLSPLLDPRLLADQAVDLNLKLMRWRILPTLDLEKVKSTKCLLLGAGTLGCYVARTLLAWGVKKITLIDSSTVSFSNPVRQPLFEFDDCLEGGKPKAEAAAKALRRIYPNVEATGIHMSIPMPGHPIPAASLEATKQTLMNLESLIAGHDVVFLLMDSRESRWLPTVIGRSQEKLVMNAALGFDSYVVMRHGLPLKPSLTDPAKEDPLISKQPGCYYCSDITAARDSLSDRTLDQMCTVTRPGLAAIASATAVELMVSVLQHPLGARAPSDAPLDINEGKRENESAEKSPLGLVPHQIRGFLAQFKSMTLSGHAYAKCTGCSSSILEAYSTDGFEFVRKACEDATFLEQVTGLDKLAQEMEEAMAQADWIEGEDENDDDF